MATTMASIAAITAEIVPRTIARVCEDEAPVFAKKKGIYICIYTVKMRSENENEERRNLCMKN